MSQKITIEVQSDALNLRDVLTALEAFMFAVDLECSITAPGYVDGVYGFGTETGWARTSDLPG